MKWEEVLQYIEGTRRYLLLSATLLQAQSIRFFIFFFFRRYCGIQMFSRLLFLSFNTFNTQFWSLNEMANKEISRSTTYNVFRVFKIEFRLLFTIFSHTSTDTLPQSRLAVSGYIFHLSVITCFYTLNQYLKVLFPRER